MLPREQPEWALDLVGIQMEQATLVHRYLEIAGEFGRSVPLSQLGLEKAELEGMIAALDEDYQISRYMQLSRSSDTLAASDKLYCINGFEYSHVSFRPGIQHLV